MILLHSTCALHPITSHTLSGVWNWNCLTLDENQCTRFADANWLNGQTLECTLLHWNKGGQSLTAHCHPTRNFYFKSLTRTKLKTSGKFWLKNQSASLHWKSSSRWDKNLPCNAHIKVAGQSWDSQKIYFIVHQYLHYSGRRSFRPWNWFSISWSNEASAQHKSVRDQKVILCEQG